MPKKIQKTLQNCLSKIKTPPPQFQSTLNSISSPKNWVLCHHPKTPSFALEGQRNNPNNNHKDDAATLADVDRFLYENFKSLYLNDDDDEESSENNKITKRVFEENQEESPKLVTTPRDLGSSRFFVKPGHSGSLVDDGGSSSTTSTTTTPHKDYSSSSNSPTNEENHTLPENCIALLTYSPSPYEEFRRSMQEVVEAKSKINDEDGFIIIDWDFMEELLFSYLNLNEKKSHRFILSAFVDLITTLRNGDYSTNNVSAKPRSVRTARKKKNLEGTLHYETS